MEEEEKEKEGEDSKMEKMNEMILTQYIVEKVQGLTFVRVSAQFHWIEDLSMKVPWKRWIHCGTPGSPSKTHAGTTACAEGPMDAAF